MWTRSRYNPETLQMEEVKLTGREIFQLVGLRVAFVLAIGAGSVWLFDQVFQSPADRARDREIAFLERQLEEMRGEVTLMEGALGDLAQRDDAVSRTILGVQPVPDHL